MKHRNRNTLSVILFSFISFYASAQHFRVEGRVVDPSSGRPLSQAYVLLGPAPDSISYSTTSGTDGSFLFPAVRAGAYVLQVSHLTYRPFMTKIRVGTEDLNLGVIKVYPDSLYIDEVAVESRQPLAKQKGDTTEYNAMAYKTTRDATAENLVEKMPGVVIREGKVEAHGEEVKEVLVDGKPFFDKDPMAALKNLPAEVIDKIQVFDKQSEQAEFTGFDDGETRKVMNLITRVGMRNGTFGKGYAGYGDQNRYMAGGNINKFKNDLRLSVVGQTNNVNRQNFSSEDLLGVMASGMRGARGAGGRQSGGGRSKSPQGGGDKAFGGSAADFKVAPQQGITQTHALGINYSDDWGAKATVTASYFFNYTDNRADQDLYRVYISRSDSGQAYTENEQSRSKNMNHRFSMKLQYNLTERTSLIFRPGLSVQLNDGTSSVAGETEYLNRMLNKSDNELASDLSALNYSGLLLLRHRFAKTGRTFSANIISGYSKSEGDQNLFAEEVYLMDTASTDFIDQRARLDADGWNLSANMMYTEPVGKNSLLELNYRHSERPSASDKRTFNDSGVPGIYSDMDTLLSNTFESLYRTDEIGAGYLLKKNRMNLTTRISWQSSRLSKDQLFPVQDEMARSFNNLLGLAVLRYRISRTRNLNITYKTYTNPPSVEQMQEVVDNSNPLSLSIGNKDLDPTYEHNLFLRYSSIDKQRSRVFFAFLNGSWVQNSIVNHTWLFDRDTLIFGIPVAPGVQLQRPENISGYWSVRQFLTYGLPLKLLRSNFNVNLSASYAHTPGFVNNDLNITHNTGVTLGLVLSSNISEFVDFTVYSRVNYNIIRNALENAGNFNYLNQTTRVRLKWVAQNGFVAETNLTQQLYHGLGEGLDDNYWIWNVSIGKKFFKNQRGELALLVYDLLDQNRSLSRNVTTAYVEDLHTVVLQRYVMLTFTYDLRSFQGMDLRRQQMRNMKRFMKPGF